jgi:hypothetical protein
MFLRHLNGQPALPLFLTLTGALLPLNVRATSCKTQSQMTAEQRDAPGRVETEPPDRDSGFFGH